MSVEFWEGFNKNAGLNRLGRSALGTFAFLGGLSGLSIGAGAGFLTKAKFEKKLKDDRDKTEFEKLISKAHIIGGLAGLGAGVALGRRHVVKNIINNPMISPIFQKRAKLKKDVKLREHQLRAIEGLIENNGSLLVAHATGSGKTLTGIAGFEKLKEQGKAKRAIVVVPASLRNNFSEKGVKAFTNSSCATYGPRNEKTTLGVDDKSSKDYNVISYDLFREHGDKIIENTGADTLIMDEIHKVRGTEGITYNKLRTLRDKFKNAITLTGSIVNNEPNEVVPLLDITYKPSGHKLVSKKFFDKLFVRKDTVTKGLFNPKVYIEKKLKNKNQLSKHLKGKIDYVSHEDLSKDLPSRELETIEVEMSPDQQKIYNFTLNSVDPITRWKIRNNIPVGQKEASAAFTKLMQGRQVSTDHSVLDKTLEKVPAYKYSPKVIRVMEDLKDHLSEDKKNKSVIFGNLIKGQVNAVEESLVHSKTPYAKFVGMGQKGSSSKTRTQAVKDFMANKKRVMLISGAGAEGLDLKNTTMMQMLEGHYNPERIQQAEARVRRLGSDINSVKIKRYLSKPRKGGLTKFIGGGDQGVDKWVYAIAKKKDDLNSDFRDVLEKRGALDNDGLSGMMGAEGAAIGQSIGEGFISRPVLYFMKKKTDKETEKKIKQKLLNRGFENLLQKRHYNKILSESKLDERILDTKVGMGLLGMGTGMLIGMNPKLQAKLIKPLIKPLSKLVPEKLKKAITSRVGFGDDSVKKMFSSAILSAAGGVATGAAIGPVAELLKRRIISGSVGDGGDLDIGIDRYHKKLKQKMERKYKSSKGYVQEYDTKKELGIDII